MPDPYGTAVMLLEIAAVIVTALVAGVFFDVAIAVLPALFQMDPGRYVEVSRLVGRGYHPTMPVLVNVGVAVQVGVLALAPSVTSTVCFGLALIALIASQFVSHLGNMRINRRLHQLNPLRIPANWSDPRPRWRAFHRIRLGLALVALSTDVVGVVIGR